MTDFEYILKQAKFFHFKGWEEGELKKCLGMLAGLSREELVALHTNKWIRSGKTLKEEIFKILFVDQLGKREERIKGASTNDLINEFEEKQTGNIALIRQELVGCSGEVVRRAVLIESDCLALRLVPCAHNALIDRRKGTEVNVRAYAVVEDDAVRAEAELRDRSVTFVNAEALRPRCLQACRHQKQGCNHTL